MFSSVGMFYILFLPLMALQLFTLLAIPALLKPGVRTTDVGHALFSYASQTAGIILMTIGGIPTLYSVLSDQYLSSSMYAGLLVVFAVGGILYLWHDAALQHLDPASRAVPKMIFACAWKFVGLMIVLLTLLSLMLRLLLQSTPPTGGWWVMHLALILYGAILSHAHLGSKGGSGFQTQSMAAMPKKRKK